MQELVNNKVYYKIFDKSHNDSTHIYAKYQSNNHDEILRNRKIVMSEFVANDILLLNQVHGSLIIDADSIEDFTPEPEADGAVTSKKHLILSVQTADCVPLLLSSDDGEIIGVAHCGWKSAKGEIILKLADLMVQKGAKRLKAVIAPSIQQHSYEVDHQYYNDFLSENYEYHHFFIESKNPKHYMFDLPGFVTFKLKKSGISDIKRMIDDTYSNPTRFPSYRRDCHLGVKYKQSILSTIMRK